MVIFHSKLLVYHRVVIRMITDDSTVEKSSVPKKLNDRTPWAIVSGYLFNIANWKPWPIYNIIVDKT